MGVMTGVARRFSLNCLLLILACLPTFAQVPPGAPSITGPQVIIMGNQYTLICTVNGGIPTPTVKWLRDDSVIDDSYTTVGQVTTNEYTFTASSAEHLEVFECQSENGILQNPLSRTVFVEVNRAPSPPVLSGPTDILSGTPTTWTCRSEGAYPQQSMQMRVGNNVFANEFSSNVVFDTVAESYTMTGTLNWAPTMVNNGNTLFCDVFHPATLGANAPQTVSLPLTVRSPLAVNAPNTLYTPKVGNPVTLQCVVTSGTATQIRWYKNNQLLNLIGNARYSGATPSNPSLTINQVILTDSGNYICEGSNANTFRNTSVITVSPRSTPSTPILNGPTQLTQGETGTWTCTSRGGYPEQRMGMRIGNSNFNNELSVQSVFDNTARTYTLTGTLVWAPNMGHNGMTVYCDVTHPETLAAPQTVSLPLTVLSQLVMLAPVTLYEPTVGSLVTLRCLASSGTPTQVRWFKAGQPIIMFGNSGMSGATVSNPSLTITSVRMADAGFYICQGSDGFVTRNTSAINLSPKASPSFPVLTGPTTVVSGQIGNWQCVSRGGFPEPTMSIRIGNDDFENELNVRSVQDPTEKTYTLTGTLSWGPSMNHDAQTMHCDVLHPETLNSPLTASLPLSVLSPLAVSAPTTFYNPMEEETVTLTCMVTAGTPSSIQWYKDAQPINILAFSRHSGGSVGTPSLTISDLQMSDSGSYVCEAADSFTQVRTSNIMLAPREKPATEYNIITSILDGYNKLVRPRDPVVNLTHSLIPTEMVEFDKMHLVFHGMQCMSWNDPRLSWTRGQPRVSLPSSVIWIPDIVLYGQKFVPDFNDTKVIVMKDGTVTYCPQGLITTRDCTERREEKFECIFRFVSWSYDKPMMEKHHPVLKPSIDMTVYREHDIFEVYQKCSSRNEVSFKCRPGIYPQLTYKFVVRRNRSYCRNLSESPTCN